MSAGPDELKASVESDRSRAISAFLEIDAGMTHRNTRCLQSLAAYQCADELRERAGALPSDEDLLRDETVTIKEGNYGQEKELRYSWEGLSEHKKRIFENILEARTIFERIRDALPEELSRSFTFATEACDTLETFLQKGKDEYLNEVLQRLERNLLSGRDSFTARLLNYDDSFGGRIERDRIEAYKIDAKQALELLGDLRRFHSVMELFRKRAAEKREPSWVSLSGRLEDVAQKAATIDGVPRNPRNENDVDYPVHALMTIAKGLKEWSRSEDGQVTIANNIQVMLKKAYDSLQKLEKAYGGRAEYGEAKKAVHDIMRGLPEEKSVTMDGTLQAGDREKRRGLFKKLFGFGK